MKPTLRHLVVVPGDQLDAGSAAFDGFDPAQDAVWMAEVSSETENSISRHGLTRSDIAV